MYNLSTGDSETIISISHVYDRNWINLQACLSEDRSFIMNCTDRKNSSGVMALSTEKTSNTV